MKRFMDKLKVSFIALIAVLMALGGPPVAFASVKAYKNNTNLGDAEAVQGVGKIKNNRAMPQGGVPLALPNFVGIGTLSPIMLTTATSPAAVVDTNAVAYIRWTSGETSKIQKTFRVPENYIEGGCFKVLVSRSGVDTAPSIAYEVFVNRTATAFDTAATTQTAVSVGTTVGSGSPVEKILLVTTDFATLQPGDMVTVNFWRNSGGTESLGLYSAEFVYNNNDV